MKPIHDQDSTEQSCSCTSCLYKSESDRPSLRRFVTHGSRIDKLYYGKYLPLRERKLLERLVRTRAVYDDLRKQILSDSSVSFSKPVLKERANKFSTDKELDRIEKSSDIIALVDLVDKGAALTSKNLSECCSCCICRSKISMDKASKRIHEHEPTHELRYAYDRRYSRVRRRISKMMVASKHKLGQISELSKNVRFRTKRVRSEPCTCTYKLSGMIKRPSIVMKKRLHRATPEPEMKPTISPEQRKSKLHDIDNVIRKSFHKVKKSHTCLCNKIEGATKRSKTKVNKSATKIKAELKSVAKKSVERLRHVKYKSGEKFEPSQPQIESLVSGDAEETGGNAFTIKKDSLTKFREQLRRQREFKDWECDPKECFRIKKRTNKRNIVENRFHDSNRIEKKVDVPSLNSDISVQVDKIENAKKTVKERQESKNNQVDKDNVDTKKKANTNKEHLKSGVNKIEYDVSPAPKMKSKRNLAQTNSILSTRSSGDITRTVISEPNKNTNIYKTEHRVRYKKRDVKSPKEEVPIGMNRQVVRVGSSFSFNIEFYKDKPIQKLPEVHLNEIPLQKKKYKVNHKKKHNATNIKEEYHNSRRTRHHHKLSGTTHIHNIMKDTQTEKHPLKKCLCTLQLKAKKPKKYENRLHKPESVQTNKMHPAHSILLPCECEPNIYVPRNFSSNKITRKRNIKHRYISTSTDLETKTVAANITSKSVSSVTPSSIQVHGVKKPESIMLSTAPAAVNVTEYNKRPKQAVRIGSTFSFNIEISKENTSGTHSNSNAKKFSRPVRKSLERPQRKKSAGKAKRYIHHKYSQISNSAGKSRHTTTKYGLRRCFCTLKLGGSEKKKKIISISRSTVTSSRSFDQVPRFYPVSKTASVGMGTSIKNYKKIKLKLPPYECEPDVCIPGECNPYKCQKLLYIRQPKRLKSRARRSNTEGRKTRSTSSLTTNPHKLTKTKKVQSAFVAYDRKVPSYVPKKTVTTSQLVNKLQPNNSSSRQTVKIGSNFSFNIEFFKEKLNDEAFAITPRFDHKITPVVNIRQRPKRIQQHNKIVLKDHEFQEMKPKRKSIQLQVEQKRRSKQIGTAMKHCFCTLKFRKKAKGTRKKGAVNTGTKTPHFSETSQLQVLTVPQTTMTKNNYKYNQRLETFECEPYVCIPGECNPYECLERIKKRDRTCDSKEMGVITKLTNLTSTSSSTQNILLPKKKVYVQPNVVELQNSSKKPKQKQLSSHLNISDKLRNINTKKVCQAVKIGSNFSFDIEFSKNQPQDQLKIIQKKIKKRDENDTKIKSYKNKGDQLFQASRSHHESQVTTKKKSKGTGVALLKKCFCTLKLWNKQEINLNQNKVTSALNQTSKPIKVYTIGRVTTENNKCTTLKKEDKQKCKVKNHIEAQISNMNRIFDFETLQSMEFCTMDNSISSSVVNTDFIESMDSFILGKSKRTLYHNESKKSIRLNYSLMEQSANFKKPSNIQNENIKDTNSSIDDKISTKYRLNKPNRNITKKTPADLSHVSYFSQSFYAMNIQLSGREKPIMNKLKPYECEPGICKPYECDPLKCQEFINKRLLKPVFTTSDSQTNIKSSSSLTSQTTPSAIKARKLQSSKAKESNKKQLPSNLKYKVISKNRQAVRIGSNFNFNIEFSKSKSNGQRLKHKSSKNNHQSHNKIKRISQIQQQDGQRKSKQIRTQYNTRNKKSQSEYMKMGHKVSNTALLKRCFCTLKLKKHRHEKSIMSTEAQTLMYPLHENNTVKLKNINSAQTIKPLKIHENTHVIKPYECTPGVCIPYQCDPYQCLKLIEKRKQTTKNNGTESIKSRNISTSSMTSGQSTKMFDNKRTESKTLDSKRNSNTSKELLLNTKPVRQAVNIGSSFSFKVEFFKDKSGKSRNDNEKSKANNLKMPSMKKMEGLQNNKKKFKKRKESFTQDIKSSFHKSSQTVFARKVQSSMTDSFIKRCFCVANLRKELNLNSGLPNNIINGDKKMQPQKKPSFLERCLCVLKSITTVKKLSKNGPNVKPAVLSQTEDNAKLFNDIPQYQNLAPYECEPGICTPGICNPYVCDRVIKNRKHVGVTRISNTDKYRTTSVSSSVRTLRNDKNKITQFNEQKVNKQRKKRATILSSGLKKNIHKKQDQEPTGMQTVRIGSNFNFDVEFYKMKGMRKTDEMDSVSATNYKYNESSKTNTKDKIIKTQNKGTYGKKSIVYNQKAQVHDIKQKSRASGVSHLLKRCFCTLSLQKQNTRKISYESPTRNYDVPVIKQNPHIRNRNTMTLDRTVYNLKPYECEPNICIPGTCDPYECEKRIKKRLQRETSTDKYKTKSTSTLISKPSKKENIKVQTKSKINKDYVYLKHANERKSSRKIPNQPSKSVNKDNNKSRKQAVKISSNFSFDVEFFKDKSRDGITKTSQQKKNQHKSAKNAFSKGPQSVSYKHKKSQDMKIMRNIDSQVLSKNVQSTMTGVTPFLKRCFCTLKLQKRKVKSSAVARNTITVGSDVKEILDVSPKIVTSNKTTRTSNRNAIYAPFMNLIPAKCEPGVCVTGKCNPNKYSKKNDLRDKRMVAKSSIIQRPQNFSTYSSARVGTKTKNSVVRKNHKHLINKKSTGFFRHPSKNRQAVCVSSSFSFNVEFFKDKKSPRFGDVPKNRKLSGKNKEYSESISKQKMKIIPIGNEASNFRHRRSQIKHARTESKGSGMGPLLKKCFCTLKLQKLGKNSKLQPVTVKIKPNLESTYTETEAIAQTRHLSPEINKIKYLEPYECASGVCIPGFCNPYECERRIKKRQLKELGTVTEHSKLKSTSSITSRNNKTKSTKSERRTMKRGYTKNDTNKPAKKNSSKVIPSPDKISNRQAVNVGSSFSFNIEFYKDRILNHTKSLPLPQNLKNSKKSKNIDTTNRIAKTYGSQVRRSSYDRGSQGTVPYTESTGSGVSTKLKRCFCTLTLQKFSGIPIPNNQFNTISKPRLKPVEVSTQTKINLNKIKRYSLEPYECEPGICIPGDCNPNECIKLMEINARRHSQTASTQQKRPSQISISSSTYPSFSKPKTMQSGGKFRKKRILKPEMKENALFKKPTFIFAPDPKNRQSVNIGSNFGFNIEFQKKSIPQKLLKESKYVTKQRSRKYGPTKMTMNSKNTKCTNASCKVNSTRSYNSQSEVIKTEDKASLVDNILKRCFCTAKLHNKPSILIRPQVNTIYRVQDQSTGYGFNQQQYYVYYQLKKSIKNVRPERCMCTLRHKNFSKFTNTAGRISKNKYLKFEPKQYDQKKYNSGTTDTKEIALEEMKTILPYTPRKFNKKNSKAILMNDNEAIKTSSQKCPPTCPCNSDFNPNSLKKSKLSDKKRSGVLKKWKNQEITPLLNEKSAKPSKSSTLKTVVSRCKEKFAKDKRKTEKSNLSEKNNKKNNKTIFTNVTGTKKSNSQKYSPTCICNSDFDSNLFQKSKLNDKKRSKASKKLVNNEIESPISKERFAKQSASSALKKVVSRCKEKYNTDETNLSENSDQCKCTSLKSKGVKKTSKLDNLKISKSERCPVDKSRNEPKASKSLKMPKIFNEKESQIVSGQRNKKYSRFQQGDTNQNKTIPAVIKLDKTGDSNYYKKYVCNDYEIKYGNKLSKSKILESSKQRKKTVKFSGLTSRGEKVEKMTILNILMKKILCKCNITDHKENKQQMEVKEQKDKRKGASPLIKNKRKFLGREENSAYCDVTCYLSENENWDETRDRSINKKIKKQYNNRAEMKKVNLNSKTQEFIEDIKKGKEITFPLVITDSPQSEETRKSLRNGKQRKGKSKGTMNSKGRKFHKDGKKIKGLHADSEGKQTSIKNLKPGAKINMIPKANKEKNLCDCRASRIKDEEAKILAKKMKGKICKCYPSVCECVKAIKIEKARMKKRKAFLKRQLKKAKLEKKRQRRLKKEKKAAGKRRRRDFFLRHKRYKVEDAIRLHKRRDLEKYLEHRIKVKGTPDYLVATESLLDLAKLSCTVLEDIARSTYRAMIDPTHTYKRVEATVKKPSRIWPIVKTAIINSGAPATFKRMILRCKTMSSIKTIRAKLEQNRCTHYLLHIADRDPRKRLKIKKGHERLKRQRVPLDFQCSLYMASLRKKPYLKVYFKCPWFYPHFINLLGVLRQLSDMLLFILAAIVWSPCILGMEICRGMMCCLLCTG